VWCILLRSTPVQLLRSLLSGRGGSAGVAPCAVNGPARYVNARRYSSCTADAAAAGYLTEMQALGKGASDGTYRDLTTAIQFLDFFVCST
jgi:hypothetical protein